MHATALQRSFSTLLSLEKSPSSYTRTNIGPFPVAIKVSCVMHLQTFSSCGESISAPHSRAVFSAGRPGGSLFTAGGTRAGQSCDARIRLVYMVDKNNVEFVIFKIF